jgi:plastocyanin
MRGRWNVIGIVAVVALSATLLGACGGDDDDSGGSGGGGETITATGGKVTIEARDTKFNAETIDATAGDLDITLVEKGNLEHTLVVEDADGTKVDGRLEVSGSGSTDTSTYPLQAGTYDFYCDIPGHRGQGMEGTIVVK